MTIKIKVILILILFPVTLWSQEFSIYLFDEQNEPLRYQNVHINQRSLLTSINGEIYLNMGDSVCIRNSIQFMDTCFEVSQANQKVLIHWRLMPEVEIVDKSSILDTLIAYLTHSNSYMPEKLCGYYLDFHIDINISDSSIDTSFVRLYSQEDEADIVALFDDFGALANNAIVSGNFLKDETKSLQRRISFYSSILEGKSVYDLIHAEIVYLDSLGYQIDIELNLKKNLKKKERKYNTETYSISFYFDKQKIINRIYSESGNVLMTRNFSQSRKFSEILYSFKDGHLLLISHIDISKSIINQDDPQKKRLTITHSHAQPVQVTRDLSAESRQILGIPQPTMIWETDFLPFLVEPPSISIKTFPTSAN